MQDKIRANVIISGKVQGVFFRVETRNAVQRIGGVSGWVRNLIDGTVEAVFEGETDKVNAVLKWCETGPSGAKVDHLNIKPGTYTGEFNSFNILY